MIRLCSATFAVMILVVCIAPAISKPQQQRPLQGGFRPINPFSSQDNVSLQDSDRFRSRPTPTNRRPPRPTPPRRRPPPPTTRSPRLRPAVGQQRSPNNSRQPRPLTMQDKLVPPTTARTQRPRPPTNRPQRPRSQDPSSPPNRPLNRPPPPPRSQRNQGPNELQRPTRPKPSARPSRNQRGPGVDDDTLPSFSAPRLFVRPEFNVFGNPIMFDHPTVEETEDLPDFRRGNSKKKAPKTNLGPDLRPRLPVFGQPDAILQATEELRSNDINQEHLLPLGVVNAGVLPLALPMEAKEPKSLGLFPPFAPFPTTV